MDQPLKEKNSHPDPSAGQESGEARGKTRILVAPLDWGLGHATRCIPIIRELVALNCDVWLAGEGAQEQLLRTEFPGLPFLQLPGYRIRYAKTRRGLLWKMILQGPKMKRAIQFEHRWLKKMVEQYHFDAVISDNRYGLYHNNVPCIFITHQLMIKSSAGKWTEKILQKRNYRYINRFSECWIPDIDGDNGLAGELSHPKLKPTIPLKYIGLLSRFQKKDLPVKKAHLLFILSGPEPQRSILEEKVIAGIGHYQNTATIVRGLPGSPSLIPSTNMIVFYNHLPADLLNNEMLEAEYIIGRSGYSTVMDIMKLQKKSILIPTPGQTEQEYLGKYLMEKGITVCLEQDSFTLDKALNSGSAYEYNIPAIPSGSTLQDAIKKILGSISKH